MKNGPTRAWCDSLEAYLVPLTRQRALAIACFFIVSLSLVEFCLQIKTGLRLFEFDDEMGTFVIAKMIVHGRHVYRDIFDTHGPVPLIITHMYASWVSASDFSYVRLSQVILAAMSCLAITGSVVFKSRLTRIWAGALYLLLLSYVWNEEGFNIIWYDTVAGFFFVVIIAQLVVPLLMSQVPGTYGTFVSGLASGLTFFCAISNAVAALLLVLSSATFATAMSPLGRGRGHATTFALGALFAIIVVGGWLAKFGDIPGYFIYHFYFNFAVYKAFSIHDTLWHLVPLMDPDDIVQALALFFIPCWLSIFLKLKWLHNPDGRSKLNALGLTILALAVVLSNLLGRRGCSDASPVNCSFALLAMSVALLLQEGLRTQSMRAILVPVAVTAVAITMTNAIARSANLWFGAKRSEINLYQTELAPRQESIYAFIRTITKKQDDFQALFWHARSYIWADREPASGNVNYWNDQAKYDKNPVDGYKIDICADMRSRKPAVIWFFYYGSINNSIDDFEPCVLDVITQRYTPLSFGSPWHIRNDIFRDSLQKLPRDADTQSLGQESPFALQLTRSLSVDSPIRLAMSPSHLGRKIALKRIALMFSTIGRQKLGDVEIHLEGPDGVNTITHVPLAEIVDNRYQFIDVKSGRYTEGELKTVSGSSDVSIWESHFGPIYTCAIFEYIDHTRRYTPACPVK